MADEKDQVQDNDPLAPLVFDEERRERPVTIGKESYLLREMMGTDLGKWQGYEQTRMKVVKNKVEIQQDAFREYAATLINLCMVDVQGAPVSKQKIMGWRSTIITGLYDACRDLNGLSPDGQEQAKKV